MNLNESYGSYKAYRELCATARRGDLIQSEDTDQVFTVMDKAVGIGVLHGVITVLADDGNLYRGFVPLYNYIKRSYNQLQPDRRRSMNFLFRVLESAR